MHTSCILDARFLGRGQQTRHRNNPNCLTSQTLLNSKTANVLAREGLRSSWACGLSRAIHNNLTFDLARPITFASTNDLPEYLCCRWLRPSI